MYPIGYRYPICIQASETYCILLFLQDTLRIRVGYTRFLYPELLLGYHLATHGILRLTLRLTLRLLLLLCPIARRLQPQPRIRGQQRLAPPPPRQQGRSVSGGECASPEGRIPVSRLYPDWILPNPA